MNKSKNETKQSEKSLQSQVQAQFRRAAKDGKRTKVGAIRSKAAELLGCNSIDEQVTNLVEHAVKALRKAGLVAKSRLDNTGSSDAYVLTTAGVRASIYDFEMAHLKKYKGLATTRETEQPTDAKIADIVRVLMQQKCCYVHPTTREYIKIGEGPWDIAFFIKNALETTRLAQVALKSKPKIRRIRAEDYISCAIRLLQKAGCLCPFTSASGTVYSPIGQGKWDVVAQLRIRLRNGYHKAKKDRRD